MWKAKEAKEYSWNGQSKRRREKVTEKIYLVPYKKRYHVWHIDGWTSRKRCWPERPHKARHRVWREDEWCKRMKYRKLALKEIEYLYHTWDKFFIFGSFFILLSVFNSIFCLDRNQWMRQGYCGDDECLCECVSVDDVSVSANQSDFPPRYYRRDLFVWIVSVMCSCSVYLRPSPTPPFISAYSHISRI